MVCRNSSVPARAPSRLVPPSANYSPQLLDLPAWVCVGPLFLTTMARGYDALHVYPSRAFIPRHYSGAMAPGDFPVFAQQYWGSTVGYDAMPPPGTVTHQAADNR